VKVLDDNKAITGWGDGLGFRINQMAAQVSYGGIRDLRRAEIMFNFSMKVSSGSLIYIEHPTRFRLRCAEYGTLKQGTLPGTLPSCTNEPMIMQLSESLVRDRTYCFSVEGDLPAVPSDPNTFNLIIRDVDLNVVDAAFLLGGSITYHDFAFHSPKMSWEGSAPDSVSIITMSMELTSIIRGNQVAALLFTFPVGYQQAASRPSDIVNGNANFPLAIGETGGWARFNAYKDKLKIHTNATYVSIIPGVYSWTFPVRMPYSSLPPVNVWYLSICSSRSCEAPYDAHTLVSFPVQGFLFGELSVQTLKLLTSGAARAFSAWSLECSWLLPVALALLRYAF
jgi:hypothetical protein